MSRSARLIQIMQYLRSRRPPVQASAITEEMQVSVRSIYRDIDSLRSAGARIDGEAGFGYTLVEDPALPPMMFSQDEMEALVLGLREVIEVADPVLADAANNALSKLQAVLPERLRDRLEHSVLYAKRFHVRPEIRIDVSALRLATREERAIDIRYCDAVNAATERRVQPLAIIFMDQTLMLIAWCQMRNDFRAFRLDRIEAMILSDESFRPKRAGLLREYFALQAAANAACMSGGSW